MRPEDVPSGTALRDTLHSKIKDSPALKMELLVPYVMLNYDDPKRSYRTLLHLMDRCIQKRREQQNLQHTSWSSADDTGQGLDEQPKGVKDTATPAPKKTGKPKTEDAAPVLPQSKAKPHAKPKPGKGGGKGNQREKAESTDGKPKMKHIRCKFFFSGMANAGMETSVHTVTPRRHRNVDEEHLQTLDEHPREVHQRQSQRKSATLSGILGPACEITALMLM